MQMHLDGVIDVESEHKRLVEEQTRALERFKHDEEIKTTQLEDELRNLIRENELIREEIRLSTAVLEDRKSHLKHSLRTQDKTLTSKLGAEKLKTADRAFKLTTRQGESERLTKLVVAEVQQLQSDLDREKRARDGVNYFLKKSLGEYETFTVSVLTSYIAEMRRQERVKAEVAENLRKMAANRGDQKGAAMVIIKAEIVLDPSRFQGSTRILASHNMRTLAQLGLGGHVMVQLNGDSGAFKDLTRASGALTQVKEASAAVRYNSKAPELVTIIADKLHIPPSDIEGVYFMPRGVFFAANSNTAGSILPTRGRGRGRAASGRGGGSNNNDDDDDEHRGNSLIGPEIGRRGAGGMFQQYSKDAAGLISPAASDLPSFSAYLQGGGTATRRGGRGGAAGGGRGRGGRRGGKTGSSPSTLGLPSDYQVQGDSPTPSARARELEVSEGGGTVGSNDPLSARPSPSLKPKRGFPKKGDALGAGGHSLGSDFSIAAALAAAAKKAPKQSSNDDDNGDGTTEGDTKTTAAAGAGTTSGSSGKPSSSAGRDSKLGSPPGTGVSRGSNRSTKVGVHDSDTDTDTSEDSDGEGDADTKANEDAAAATTTEGAASATGESGSSSGDAKTSGTPKAGSKPGSAKPKKGTGSRPGTGSDTNNDDTKDGTTAAAVVGAGGAATTTGANGDESQSTREDPSLAAGLVDSRPRTADDRPASSDSQAAGTPSAANSKNRAGFMAPIEEGKLSVAQAKAAKQARKEARREQRREERHQVERNGSESARKRLADEKVARQERRQQRRSEKEAARLSADMMSPTSNSNAPSARQAMRSSRTSNTVKSPISRVRSAGKVRSGQSPARSNRVGGTSNGAGTAGADQDNGVDENGEGDQPQYDEEAAAAEEAANNGEVVLDENGQPIVNAAGGYFQGTRARRVGGRPQGGLTIPGFGGADAPGSNRIVTAAQLSHDQRRRNSYGSASPPLGDGSTSPSITGGAHSNVPPTQPLTATGTLPFGARMAARAAARAEAESQRPQRGMNSSNSLPLLGTRLTADGRRVPLRSGMHGASAFGPYDENAAAAAAATEQQQQQQQEQYAPVEYVNAPAPHIGGSVLLRGHNLNNRRSTAPAAGSASPPPDGVDVTWEESGGLLLPHVTAGYGVNTSQQLMLAGSSPLRAGGSGATVGLTSPGLGRSVGRSGTIMRGGGGAIRSPAGQVRSGAPGGAVALSQQAGNGAHVMSYGTLGPLETNDTQRTREPMVAPLQGQQQQRGANRGGAGGPWTTDANGNPIATSIDGTTVMGSFDGTVVSNSVRAPRSIVLSTDVAGTTGAMGPPSPSSSGGASVLGGGFSRRPTAPTSPRALFAAQQAAGGVNTSGSTLVPPGAAGLILGGDGRPIPTFPSGTLPGGMPPPVVHHLQSGVSPRRGRDREASSKPGTRDPSEEKTRSLSPGDRRPDGTLTGYALIRQEQDRRSGSRSPGRGTYPGSGPPAALINNKAPPSTSVAAKVVKANAGQGRSIMGKDQEQATVAALSAMLPLRGVGSGMNPPLSSTTPISQTVKQARSIQQQSQQQQPQARGMAMSQSITQHHQYIHGSPAPPYLLSPMTSIPSVNGSLSVITSGAPTATNLPPPSMAMGVMASPIAGRIASRHPLNDPSHPAANAFGSTSTSQPPQRTLNASASVPTFSRTANPTLSLAVGQGGPPLRAKYSFASSTHSGMSDGVARSTSTTSSLQSSISYTGGSYSVAAANQREQAERQARMLRIEARRIRQAGNGLAAPIDGGVTFAPGTVSPQVKQKRLAPSSSAPLLVAATTDTATTTSAATANSDTTGASISSTGVNDDTSSAGGDHVGGRSGTDVLVVHDEAKEEEDDIVEQKLTVAPTSQHHHVARVSRGLSLSPRAAAAALDQMHGRLDRLPSIDVASPAAVAAAHAAASGTTTGNDGRPRSSGSPSASKRRQSSVLEPDVQTSPGGRRAPLVADLAVSGNNMESVLAGISSHLVCLLLIHFSLLD
jgi:hypothetical protein